MSNSGRANPNKIASNKIRSNQPSVKSDGLDSNGLDRNNNLAASRNGVNEMATGSAMNELTNQANLADNLNGHGDNPMQFTNGPTNVPSTEPNSISNSRNSYLDETNSFSNSVTPDQQNLRTDRMVEERTATPFTSPVVSPNPLGHLNQLNKSRPSNETNQQSQSHRNSSESNGLTSPTADEETGKSCRPYESQLVSGIKVPSKRLRLKKIFGYRGDVVGNNLQILSTDEIAYFVGVFVVLWDPVLNVQRHYSEHTEDIVW